MSVDMCNSVLRMNLGFSLELDRRSDRVRCPPHRASDDDAVGPRSHHLSHPLDPYTPDRENGCRTFGGKLRSQRRDGLGSAARDPRVRNARVDRVR